jgi:hypothetical protein
MLSRVMLSSQLVASGGGNQHSATADVLLKNEPTRMLEAFPGRR